jgi:molybdopterin molybdotransferase
MDVRTKGFSERVSVADALDRVLSRVRAMGSEEVDLLHAQGRVLAEDVVAQLDVPPFDRAAMDGYALKGENTFGASQGNPLYFKVVGEVMPGRSLGQEIQDYEAARIMTGAPMPRGANAVVMFEYVSELGDEIEVVKAVTPGKNVSRRGEDVEKGELLLRKGKRLKPQDVALMAALGIGRIQASRIPTVGIIATGDELVEPGRDAGAAAIYDANSYSVFSMVRRDGGAPRLYGIVKDDYLELKETIQKALREDVVVITGATSVGERDFVPQIVGELGEVAFHGVAMRPGEPTGAAFAGGRAVFMLPGYPVAAIFAYETFVRPALEKMLGLRDEVRYPTVEGRLTRRIASELGRRDYVRVRLMSSEEGLLVEPLMARGSGVITSLVRANGFVVVPENTEGIEEGTRVEVNIF